jgi:hypothetical protein
MTGPALDDETLAKLNAIRSPALRFLYMLFKAWTTPQRLCSACKPGAHPRSTSELAGKRQSHAKCPADLP